MMKPSQFPTFYRELAQLLEQHRSTNAGGRLLPATWSESKLQVMPDDSSILPALQDKPVVNHKQPSTATRGYLKTWLRGLDISSSPFKSIAANGNKAVTPPVTISTRPSDDSNNGVARSALLLILYIIFFISLINRYYVPKLT